MHGSSLVYSHYQRPARLLGIPPTLLMVCVLLPLVILLWSVWLNLFMIGIASAIVTFVVMHVLSARFVSRDWHADSVLRGTMVFWGSRSERLLLCGAPASRKKKPAGRK